MPQFTQTLGPQTTPMVSTTTEEPTFSVDTGSGGDTGSPSGGPWDTGGGSGDSGGGGPPAPGPGSISDFTQLLGTVAVVFIGGLLVFAAWPALSSARDRLAGDDGYRPRSHRSHRYAEE